MIAKEEVVLQNKDVKIEIFLHKNDTLFIRQGAEQVHANNVGESPK